MKLKCADVGNQRLSALNWHQASNPVLRIGSREAPGSLMSPPIHNPVVMFGIWYSDQILDRGNFITRHTPEPHWISTAHK